MGNEPFVSHLAIRAVFHPLCGLTCVCTGCGRRCCRPARSGETCRPPDTQPVQVVHYDETAVRQLADAGVVLFQSQETLEFVSPDVSLPDVGELRRQEWLAWPLPVVAAGLLDADRVTGVHVVVVCVVVAIIAVRLVPVVALFAPP